MITSDMHSLLAAVKKVVPTSEAHADTLDDFEDPSEETIVGTSHSVEKNSLHLDMLKFVLEASKEIRDTIKSGERTKTKWRTAIFIMLFVFLVATVCMACIIAFRGDVPGNLMLGLLGAFFAQLASLLVLFVKFVNDTEHLKMFQTVMHKLLDYVQGSLGDSNR